MSIVFVGALIFAWQTRGQRGGRSLAESPALGYLPDDTNLIMAMNVAAADEARRERKADKEPDIVDRLCFSPNAMLPVERWTGLTRGDVEEIVVGLKVDANLIPKVRLIVRTRSSYNAASVRERLGSFRSKQDGSKQIDLIRPNGLPVEAVLWCATERTFVVTITPEDMQRVPDEPAKNVERLAAPLVDLMRYRTEKGTYFWLMGHSEDWEKTSLKIFLNKWTVEERKKLFRVRTFAAAMRVDGGVVTSRARPARITEKVDPGERGLAVELAVITATDADSIVIREACEAWIKNKNLEMRDGNLNGPLYTMSMAGSALEWEKAIDALRAGISFR
jgi:hypothetical protein